MTNLVPGGFAIVGWRSPPNEGRLVRMVECKGMHNVPKIGLIALWYIIPVTEEKLVTQKLVEDGVSPYKCLVPENWVYPITIDDPNLDVFLLQWSVDDQILRYNESDFDGYGASS